MDLTVIIAAVSAVIKTAVDVGPGVIKLAEDAEPFAKEIVALFTGNTITQDQVDMLQKNVEGLGAELQARAAALAPPEPSPAPASDPNTQSPPPAPDPTIAPPPAA